MAVYFKAHRCQASQNTPLWFWLVIKTKPENGQEELDASERVLLFSTYQNIKQISREYIPACREYNFLILLPI